MPPDRRDDDERPKPSWRDRDKAREGGQGARGTQKAPRPNSQAYRAYKTQLNRLFDEGLPEAVGKGREGAKEVFIGKKAQRDLEEALLSVPEGPALTKAALSHIAEHGLPKREEVLARLMTIDDSKVAREALAALGVMVSEGTLKRRQALKGRLEALIMVAESQKVAQAAKSLLTALGADARG